MCASCVLPSVASLTGRSVDLSMPKIDFFYCDKIVYKYTNQFSHESNLVQLHQCLNSGDIDMEKLKTKGASSILVMPVEKLLN